MARQTVAFTPQPYGALAPLAVGMAGSTWEVPEGLGDEEAAAFLLASHTAHHALHHRGRLREGETVLVHGAAGGLGSAAVQLARAAGARVIAVAGGPEKKAFCESLGADVAIDHRAEDFVAATREATGGRGVDCIFDPVQGEAGERSRSLLAPDGRHILCGHAGGLLPIDPKSFYMQNYTLVGACMGFYPPDQGLDIETRAHADILRLLREGRFQPVVGSSVAWHEVPAALTALAARQTQGRITVRVG